MVVVDEALPRFEEIRECRSRLEGGADGGSVAGEDDVAVNSSMKEATAARVPTSGSGQSREQSCVCFFDRQMPLEETLARWWLGREEGEGGCSELFVTVLIRSRREERIGSGGGGDGAHPWPTVQTA